MRVFPASINFENDQDAIFRTLPIQFKATMMGFLLQPPQHMEDFCMPQYIHPQTVSRHVAEANQVSTQD